MRNGPAVPFLARGADLLDHGFYCHKDGGSKVPESTHSTESTRFGAFALAVGGSAVEAGRG